MHKKDEGNVHKKQTIGLVCRYRPIVPFNLLIQTGRLSLTEIE